MSRPPSREHGPTTVQSDQLDLFPSGRESGVSGGGWRLSSASLSQRKCLQMFPSLQVNSGIRKEEHHYFFLKCCFRGRAICRMRWSGLRRDLTTFKPINMTGSLWEPKGFHWAAELFEGPVKHTLIVVFTLKPLGNLKTQSSVLKGCLYVRTEMASCIQMQRPKPMPQFTHSHTMGGSVLLISSQWACPPQYRKLSTRRNSNND